MNKKYACFGLLLFLMASCSTNKPEVGENNNSTENNNNNNNNNQETELDEELKNWLESDEASDLNLDGKKDKLDYEYYKNYKAWKVDTSKSKDYTDDHLINIDDYRFYLGYNEFLSSEISVDYNLDKLINEEDYKIHLAYMNWAESEEARDLNQDRKIDYKDYVLSLDPNESYFAWKETSLAKDYNNDGTIDETDFYTYKFFGKYQARNYKYSGYDLYLDLGNVSARDLGPILTEAKIIYSENGTQLCLTENGVTALQGNAPAIIKLFNEATLEVTSPISFNYTVPSKINDIDTPLKFYFNYDKVNNEYDTELTFTYEQKETTVSFSLFEIK